MCAYQAERSFNRKKFLLIDEIFHKDYCLLFSALDYHTCILRHTVISPSAAALIRVPGMSPASLHVDLLKQIFGREDRREKLRCTARAMLLKTYDRLGV